MTRTLFTITLLLLTAGTFGAGPVTELDMIANERMLETHFARYGFEPLKTIRREDSWLHIELPGGKKGVGQTGVYSYVTLAGDFEVEAQFLFGDVPVVRGGYGMSIGIGVDTNGRTGNLQWARQYSQDRDGNGFIAVRGEPGPDGTMKYTPKVHATELRRGRLALRRENDELVCLAGPENGALEELDRIPFTAGVVRAVRFYADAGGSPTALNAWVGQARLRAREITGGFSRLGQPRPFPLWIVLLVVGGSATAAAWLFRRRRASGPRVASDAAIG